MSSHFKVESNNGTSNGVTNVVTFNFGPTRHGHHVSVIIRHPKNRLIIFIELNGGVNGEPNQLLDSMLLADFTEPLCIHGRLQRIKCTSVHYGLNCCSWAINSSQLIDLSIEKCCHTSRESTMIKYYLRHNQLEKQMTP
jgi:hypothetical protein